MNLVLQGFALGWSRVRLKVRLAQCLASLSSWALLVGVWSPSGFAQNQRAFTLLKTLEQQKLTEELQLIRVAQHCVDDARSLEALQECHREERLREWQQRELFRRRIDAVRARFGLRRPGFDRGAPPGPPPPGGPPAGPGGPGWGGGL